MIDVAVEFRFDREKTKEFRQLDIIMNRRNFITNTLASTAALATSTDVLAQKSNKTNLEVLVLATNWGFEGSNDDLCKKVKGLGYDGIEVWWPGESYSDLIKALQKYELQVGFLCGGSDSNFEKHAAQFKKAVTEAAASSVQKPLYINCHSGRDYFEPAQNSKLIDFAIEKSEQSGVGIYHETHRSRMCFAAHVTKAFLEKHPKMKLTLDISHWTNVHESLLDDQPEAVNLALQRTEHIHARIGHQEGPQVNDPRAPEWKAALDKHLGWWDQVIKNKEKSGSKRITFLTEFGPPTYLPTLPYTMQPVADQWDINVHMLNLIKNRYTK